MTGTEKNVTVKLDVSEIINLVSGPLDEVSDVSAAVQLDVSSITNIGRSALEKLDNSVLVDLVVALSEKPDNSVLVEIAMSGISKMAQAGARPDNSLAVRLTGESSRVGSVLAAVGVVPSDDPGIVGNSPA